MEVSRTGFSAVIGNGHGMRFPLQPDTNIVLGRIHGQADQPFIFGAFYQDDHVNPVTAHNPFHHLIKTSIGHRLLMDDDPVEPNILLETADRENELRLVGGEASPGIVLCSHTGAIRMEAVNDIVIEATQDITVNAKAPVMMTAASWMVSAAESGLSFNASENIEVNAGEHCEINVAGVVGLSVGGDLRHTVTGAFVMRADQDMTFHSQSGRLAINAAEKHNITVTTLDGSIMFKVGDSEIVLNPNGKLSVKGREINIISPEVNLNGEIV